MVCHIVPCVYLNAWKVLNYNSSIYIFKKEDWLNSGTLRNIEKLTKTSFCVTNFYYLKMENCKTSKYDFLFKPIFEKLNEDYIFKCRNQIIEKENVGIFRTIYLSRNKDLTIIRRCDNKEIKNESFKTIIESLWKDKQKRYIEDFFHDNLENLWNSFLEDIEKSQYKLNNEQKEYLILFITLQLFRNGKRIDNILKNILPCANLPNYDLSNFQNNMLNELLLGFIEDFYNKNINSNNIIYNACINLNKTKWAFTFYYRQEGDFITSDNPSFVDKINKTDFIVLPITPKICLVMNISDNESYSLKNADNNMKNNLNLLIHKNCYKYVAYHSEKIQ